MKALLLILFFMFGIQAFSFEPLGDFKRIGAEKTLIEYERFFTTRHAEGLIREIYFEADESTDPHYDNDRLSHTVFYLCRNDLKSCRYHKTEYGSFVSDPNNSWIIEEGTFNHHKHEIINVYREGDGVHITVKNERDGYFNRLYPK